MDTDVTIQPKTTISLLSALITYSGKSQKKIAEAAGMPPSHLNRILRGTIDPTDRTFLRIIQATGTPREIVGIALIVGPDNLPILAQSDFVTRLCAELPTQLLERLGENVIYADPRWANLIVQYVVTKTEQTMDRKLKADTAFMPDL